MLKFLCISQLQEKKICAFFSFLKEGHRQLSSGMGYPNYVLNGWEFVMQPVMEARLRTHTFVTVCGEQRIFQNVNFKPLALGDTCHLGW